MRRRSFLSLFGLAPGLPKLNRVYQALSSEVARQRDQAMDAASYRRIIEDAKGSLIVKKIDEVVNSRG
jgi:hypothetical protein